MKRLYIVALLSMLILNACANKQKESINGLWSPNIIDQTGSRIKQEMLIEDSICTLIFNTGDSIVRLSSPLTYYSTNPIEAKACFNYYNEIEDGEQCFCIRYKDGYNLFLWDCLNDNSMIEYNKIRH